jgi:hypothetical protein
MQFGFPSFLYMPPVTAVRSLIYPLNLFEEENIGLHIFSSCLNVVGSIVFLRQHIFIPVADGSSGLFGDQLEAAAPPAGFPKTYLPQELPALGCARQV